MRSTVLLAAVAALTFSATAEAKNPVVVMETSMGSIEIELFEDKAPESVKNFLGYVDAKYYDGTIFHRVIDNFMIQGGGFTEQLAKKDTRAPVKNEAHNGLENKRGTVAMARTAVVDSATSQFFVNVVDNDFLNHRGKSPREYGYAVFGRVIRGMDVVDKIKKVRTGACGAQFSKDCPQTPVVIKSIRRKAEGAPAKEAAAKAPAKKKAP
jgi:cyclophilin family peptidyl-prolyl cis-trans isomerase